MLVVHTSFTGKKKKGRNFEAFPATPLETKYHHLVIHASITILVSPGRGSGGLDVGAFSVWHILKLEKIYINGTLKCTARKFMFWIIPRCMFKHNTKSK